MIRHSTLLLLLLVAMPVNAADFTLRTIVNASAIRVGQPFELTVRFRYDTCCIRSPVFSPLNIAGAEVSERSAPEQYEETVAGIRYGVYEFHYTVTPEQQGVLTIPKLTLTGEQIPSSAVFTSEGAFTVIEVESEPQSILVNE